MMRRAKVCIREAGTRAHDDHRRLVVADVDADLLEAARGREWGNGVDDGPQPGKRHAGGDTHHVGLGDAAVEKAAWGPLLELVEELVADIAGEQHDARVTAAE